MLLSRQNPHLNTKLRTCYNCSEGRRCACVDTGWKELHENANRFVRTGIFSALVVIVVLILKIQGLQGAHHTLLPSPSPCPGWNLFPRSAWRPSSLGLGPAWLLRNKAVDISGCGQPGQRLPRRPGSLCTPSSFEALVPAASVGPVPWVQDLTVVPGKLLLWFPN